MDKNRILIVAILVGGLLIGIVFVIFILRNIFTSSSPVDEDTITPTNSQPRETQDRVQYDQENTDELLRIVTQRPTPPPSDQEIRNSLIQSLDGETGILYETDEIKIEYVSAPDDFEVEIKTTEIDNAKEIGVAWFRSQGFSDEGICSLPAFFYLNYQVIQSMESDYTFEPLPEFCL